MFHQKEGSVYNYPSLKRSQDTQSCISDFYLNETRNMITFYLTLWTGVSMWWFKDTFQFYYVEEIERI